LPPMTARAAVSGQPSTGLARLRPLPRGDFFSAAAIAATLVIKTPWFAEAAGMIVEMRNYKITPGRRAEFVRQFTERAGPAQVALGMRLLCPLLVMEEPDTIIFLRAFLSMEERHRMKDAFYDGPLWKKELEGLMMPLIESYSATLCESAPDMFDSALATPDC
jgi:hypothetical protein